MEGYSTYSWHLFSLLQCKVCMQTFICTTSEVKCREHAEACWSICSILRNTGKGPKWGSQKWVTPMLKGPWSRNRRRSHKNTLNGKNVRPAEVKAPTRKYNQNYKEKVQVTSKNMVEFWSRRGSVIEAQQQQTLTTTTRMLQKNKCWFLTRTKASKRSKHHQP